jgi:hypothetical protein
MWYVVSVNPLGRAVYMITTHPLPVDTVMLGPVTYEECSKYLRSNA